MAFSSGGATVFRGTAVALHTATVPGKQEDPVHGMTERDVEEANHVELRAQTLGPAIEHVIDGDPIFDGKREIEIGPAVSRVMRKRADDGGRDDTRIGA